MTFTDLDVLDVLSTQKHPIDEATLVSELMSGKAAPGEVYHQVTRVLDALTYTKRVIARSVRSWQGQIGDFPGSDGARWEQNFYAHPERVQEWTARAVFSRDDVLAAIADRARPISITEIAIDALSGKPGLRPTIVNGSDVWRHTSEHHLRVLVRALAAEGVLHEATGAALKAQQIRWPGQTDRATYWCLPQLHKDLLGGAAARREEHRQDAAHMEALHQLAQRHPGEYAQLLAQILAATKPDTQPAGRPGAQADGGKAEPAS